MKITPTTPPACAIGAILEKSFSNVPKENHIIALISDHGTGFMRQENEFQRTERCTIHDAKRNYDAVC